jgi:hypothetical protein
MEKTNYDDNPRYQKVAEGEYRDTETNETVLVFEGDDADMVRFALKMNDHQDEYVLTESEIEFSWRLADRKEVFESLPKPKASVPSSLGMVRKW